jgi:hypothetical protein
MCVYAHDAAHMVWVAACCFARSTRHVSVRSHLRRGYAPASGDVQQSIDRGAVPARVPCAHFAGRDLLRRRLIGARRGRVPGANEVRATVNTAGFALDKCQ